MHSKNQPNKKATLLKRQCNDLQELYQHFPDLGARRGGGAGRNQNLNGKPTTYITLNGKVWVYIVCSGIPKKMRSGRKENADQDYKQKHSTAGEE